MQALEPVPEVLPPPPPPRHRGRGKPNTRSQCSFINKGGTLFLNYCWNEHKRPTLGHKSKNVLSIPLPFIQNVVRIITKEATNVMCLGELSQSHTFSFSITSAQTRSPFSSWICSLTSFICLTAMNLASRLRSSARTSRMFCETRPFIALTFTLKCSWLSKNNSLLI